MLGLFNSPSIFSPLTRFNQQAKASQAATLNNDQQSPNKPIRLSNFADKPLYGRLKGCLLEKLTEKTLALFKDNFSTETKSEHSKFYVDFAWPKLTQLRKKFLAHADKKQPSIDSLPQKLKEQPEEIQELIWNEPGALLLYWQAHTLPSAQNKSAYFLRDKNDQPVLDDHNQAVQDPHYRYHLLARRNIPLDYQQQILANDTQLYKLFCSTQFRENLLTQFAQKPLTQIAIDTNIQQCALLLFFLRTKEEAALEECQCIIDIFESYLAQAQPKIIEQALVGLIQYLPSLPQFFDVLQSRVEKLIKHLLPTSNNQATPIWAGAVCANLASIQDILSTQTVQSIQANLLSRVYVKKHGPQLIDYLQQIIRRIQIGNVQSNELFLLAHLHNYPLLKNENPHLRRWIVQILSKNLLKIREELQRMIQTFQSAPSHKLNSLVKILQLRAFLTENQRIEASKIMRANVKYLPKALWSQALPFLQRQQPRADFFIAMPTDCLHI